MSGWIENGYSFLKTFPGGTHLKLSLPRQSKDALASEHLPTGEIIFLKGRRWKETRLEEP